MNKKKQYPILMFDNPPDRMLRSPLNQSYHTTHYYSKVPWHMYPYTELTINILDPHSQILTK